MFERHDALLVIIDVQERMMPAIHEGDAVIAEVNRMIAGCRELRVPIVVTEQYPQGLGGTVHAVRTSIGPTFEPIQKLSFSACGELQFMRALETLNRQHVLLCGVETHVCVYQTAMDLVQLGWDVEVVTDAVGSRRVSNKDLALRKLRRHDVDLTSVEMALFEMMLRSDTPEFKNVSRIVK